MTFKMTQLSPWCKKLGDKSWQQDTKTMPSSSDQQNHAQLSWCTDSQKESTKGI